MAKEIDELAQEWKRRDKAHPKHGVELLRYNEKEKDISSSKKG
ncbi:hypothetical protein [Fictibacillus enclensis]|nr:hypothetical protein [Fictibacillus enclensis]WHY74754.1 hypothetical protein QNH15_12960 [Fictibacillus enclensis]